MAQRVLIVGWDGADWDILDPLLEAGELPASKRSSNADGEGCRVRVSRLTPGPLGRRSSRGATRAAMASSTFSSTGPEPHAACPCRGVPSSAPTWPERLTEAGKTTLLLTFR